VKRIDLGAGSFSYIDAGTTNDPPIVLLHAMGRSAADWEPIIEYLQDDFRVRAFDMRGHGNSCRPGEYSFELMRDDLLGFVDALALKRFHLIGHSLGATTSILFAERWPDRIDRLVLEDTPPPSGHPQVPVPPDEPPEPVSFDWPVIAQIVAQLNNPDPAWWSDLSKIIAPTLIIGGG
jgi:pimeloyl-ACP methyl ester carboxylesterase